MGRYSGKSCRLSTMLLMTSSFFLVEIIVGYLTNSMALVADSFHMLSDVVSLLVGFFAVRISKKTTKHNTFGWVRAEVLGALINSVFLVALCFTIMVQSLTRLIEVERIDNPKLILIVGSLGLVVNLIGLLLFREQGSNSGGSSKASSQGRGGLSQSEAGDDQSEVKAPLDGNNEQQKEQSSVVNVEDSDDEEDTPNVASSAQLNMRAVFLHVMGDALGSVIVIVSALIIWFAKGDWKYYVDPAISLAMVMIILTTTMPLLRESAMILLQRVPSHIKLDVLQSKLLKKVSGVLGVHEFHVWRLAGNKIIASMHIQCSSLDDYMEIATQIKQFFHREGIHSTTIQPEFVEFTELDDDAECTLECVPAQCVRQTCCGRIKKQSASTDPNHGVAATECASTQTTKPANGSSLHYPGSTTAM